MTFAVRFSIIFFFLHYYYFFFPRFVKNKKNAHARACIVCGIAVLEEKNIIIIRGAQKATSRRRRVGVTPPRDERRAARQIEFATGRAGAIVSL